MLAYSGALSLAFLSQKKSVKRSTMSGAELNDEDLVDYEEVHAALRSPEARCARRAVCAASHQRAHLPAPPVPGAQDEVAEESKPSDGGKKCVPTSSGLMNTRRM